uniref:Craniofacial development protein 2 n=1 Tax=Cacopsylla melanoneura TaxID=428564 RepID=A0A8D9EGU9_9HEMI
MDWKPISERIIMVRLRNKVRNITIIQCYAPTEEATEDDKDNFYEQLNEVMRTTKKQDIKIILGDFNAKVGSDNEGVELVMGRHGAGTRNDNGSRLIEFCGMNELVIGGTIFPHKNCHKLTWTSPDGQTQNQIDHILMCKKWRSSLLDTRSKTGADCGSDHNLVIAEVRLKIATIKSFYGQRQKFYDVEKLKEKDTARDFNLELRNRFQTLDRETDETVENRWGKLKKIIKDTSEQKLGYKTKTKKPWISSETNTKIEERRQLKKIRDNAKTRDQKTKANKDYYDRHREVKRSFRNDKRKWAENLAKEAQKAANTGNIKELYNTTKQLANKQFRSKKPIKDKNGNALYNDREQIKRWQEYFKELFEKNSDENLRENETDVPGDARISCDPPTKSEICKAVKEMKNGKSPGIDHIPAEVLKCNPDTTSDILFELFKQIWETEEFPEDWKKGLLIKLPKKGDLSQCQNWRGITLLSIPSKVLMRVILNRIKTVIDTKLRREQHGFRAERSCTDLINTLRIIVEQSTEYQTHLFLTFVDFERAFDSVSREAMWKALKDFGVPRKIINLIKSMYNGYKCQVLHEGQLSDPFNVEIGTRQGCLLSPLIFLLVLDRIMTKVTKIKRGIQWGLMNRLEDIDFADDICLLSQNLNDMKNKIEDLRKESAKAGLKINVKKTKRMDINCRGNEDIMLDGEIIEKVESFQYLGSVVTTNGGADEDVTQRILKARRAFIQLNPIWKSAQLRRRTKLRIFQKNGKSILLYGCQTWKVTKTLTGKLQTFINSCLRRILNIRWPEKITNIELWNRCNEDQVEHVIRDRKYGWIGHTLRRKDTISKEALDWNPQGRRGIGRPRQTWKRTVEREIAEAGKSWGEVKGLAQNRVRWRSFVEALRPP